MLSVHTLVSLRHASISVHHTVIKILQQASVGSPSHFSQLFNSFVFQKNVALFVYGFIISCFQFLQAASDKQVSPVISLGK